MPEALPKLNNFYYLLRHGQSTANVEGIISSARSLAGSTKHGLTVLGETQGRDAASPLVDLIAEDVVSNDGETSKQVFFYSSPFARAKETAYACLEGMKAEEEVAKKVKELGLEVKEDVLLDDGLMERFVCVGLGKIFYTYLLWIFEPFHSILSFSILFPWQIFWEIRWQRGESITAITVQDYG